jgi:uncharacterized protein involved in outer membrane biogenesis
MTDNKRRTQILKSLLISIAVISMIVALLDYLELSFNFNSARNVLVKQIKSVSGREARIDGDVALALSLPPQLLVQKIQISNPDGFSEEDFISVSKVRIDIHLIPLFSGQLHLSDVSADQAKINLIINKDGSDNWTFDNSGQIAKAHENSTDNSNTRTSGSSRLSIGKFELTNVTISYHDQAREQVINTQLDQLSIDIQDIANPRAEMKGDVQGYPYNLTFRADDLQLLASGEPWLLHGAGHIADRETEIEASSRLIDKRITSDIAINVTNVNLGILLDKLQIISGQEASTEKISIKTRIHGSGLTELYEQAEIDLHLGNGHWILQSEDTGHTKKLLFTKASAFTSWQQPVVLNLDGEIEDEAIKIEFITNRLVEFFDEVHKLDVNLDASIADTDIKLSGTLDLPITSRQFKLDLSIDGKHLEKLNPLIDTDFPALNDFKLSGNLIANDKGYVLKSAKASIGESHLQTSIVIDTTAEKPLWIINLSSKQLQLKDFAFYDWESKQGSISSENSSTEKEIERPYHKSLRELQATVEQPDMNLKLNLKVDKLLSGQDILGKATFILQMRENAISLENADIELPGGRITASLSFNIEDSGTSGHAILNIEKLDYGITARFFKPDSQVDGVISLRTDIKLAGSEFTRLLENATGQVDIAVWPKNTRPAKILDLWATNLYLVLLPELKKKESKVNCLVGLMNIDNGIMKEEFFAIDTTKLWIYGNFTVDFKQEQVKLSLFPRSKTARLFALESPIRVLGSFSDIGLAVTPVDLATSYISFVTSPLVVPTRWIFGDEPPEDGSAICEQFLDRPYVEKLNAEIKRKEKLEIDKMLESE